MKYVCDICGYVYDPELGDPDNSGSPGHLGRKSPKTGPARSAALAEISSAKKNNEYAKAEKERSFSAFIRPFPLSDTSGSLPCSRQTACTVRIISLPRGPGADVPENQRAIVGRILRCKPARNLPQRLRLTRRPAYRRRFIEYVQPVVAAMDIRSFQKRGKKLPVKAAADGNQFLQSPCMRRRSSVPAICCA